VAPTTTIVYCDTDLITAAKRFTLQAPGGQCFFRTLSRTQKPFLLNFYQTQINLEKYFVKNALDCVMKKESRRKSKSK
jgi:hypothetical protein